MLILIYLRVLAKYGVLMLLGVKGRYTSKASCYFPGPYISASTSGLGITLVMALIS